MRFIDANIFIRHLTGDDPVKAQACFDLFQLAERGEVSLTTSESVVAEVVYVLASKQLYNLTRPEIRRLLYPLLSLPGLKLAARKLYLRALDIYATFPIDFGDALVAAHMERQDLTELYSYDRDFDPLAGMKRLEP